MARLTTTWLTLAAAGGASVTGVGALDLARDGGLRAGSFAETTIGSPLDDPSVEGRFAVSAGYELVITCWGEGPPTIVLEPGHPDSGHDQFGGTPFLEELASTQRVCVYDRAGEGASDAPPIERRDADDVVRDLHDVLAAADVEGPHLLVGASFGGMIVTHYAATYPDDVVGVVLPMSRPHRRNSTVRNSRNCSGTTRRTRSGSTSEPASRADSRVDHPGSKRRCSLSPHSMARPTSRINPCGWTAARTRSRSNSPADTTCSSRPQSRSSTRSSRSSIGD